MKFSMVQIAALAFVCSVSAAPSNMKARQDCGLDRPSKSSVEATPIVGNAGMAAAATRDSTKAKATDKSEAKSTKSKESTKPKATKTKGIKAPAATGGDSDSGSGGGSEAAPTRDGSGSGGSDGGRSEPTPTGNGSGSGGSGGGEATPAPTGGATPTSPSGGGGGGSSVLAAAQVSTLSSFYIPVLVPNIQGKWLGPNYLLNASTRAVLTCRTDHCRWRIFRWRRSYIRPRCLLYRPS